MAETDLYTASSRKLRARIASLVDEPEGVLYDKRSPKHRIVIRKDEGIVRMFFMDPNFGVDVPVLSGAMSAVDPNDPLDLSPTPYNQAMMLTLLWNPEPASVYVLGFAGGRLPLLFHTLFPQVTIDSTDIDSDVVALAERFFAIEQDNRQRIIIQDGREYLERQSKTQYDIILIDAFRGTGFSPFHLSTVEFYETCRKHLRPNGVVAVNLVEADELFERKIVTLEKSFQNVYVQVARTITAFGTDAAVPALHDVSQRARELNNRHQFRFPYVERAESLARSVDAGELQIPNRHAPHVLVDADPPDEVTRELSRGDAIFYKVGRNEACPCGSGKKFKKCHGRSSRL